MIKVHIQDLVNKKNALTRPVCKKIFSSIWKKKAEITIRITTSAESQRLNFNFRNQNKPTNILSFNIESNTKLVGDLVLCHDIVKKEAKEQNKNIKDHYIHLILHGFLHLIGHDHLTEKDQLIMETIEIKTLKLLNIQNPYISND